MLLSGNIKTEKGVKLQCGNCKKGTVKFYPKQNETL